MFICQYIVDQKRPKPKQFVIKKNEPKKTETAVFAIKTDRNRTGESRSNLGYPTIYSRASFI